MTAPAPGEGTATRGTRIAGLTPADLAPTVPVEPITISPTGETGVDTTRVGATQDPEPALVVTGDVIAASSTLAIDLNTGGTSFFRYEHKTVVQPGETNDDVYGRVAATVNDGVINLIDDVEDRLAEHDKARAEAEARLAATHGQQA